MANLNPLLARIEEMTEDDQELVLVIFDYLMECGFDVPSTKEVREKLEKRLEEKHGEL